MTTSIAGLAKLVGTSQDGSRTWLVDGEFYDDDGLDKLIAKQHALTESEALIGREMGETLGGLDVQRKADRILRDRGIHPSRATHQELLDALVEVSP
jgi:hypothetical protein